MKLKKFNEYSNLFSKDPRNFERQVVIVGDPTLDLFENSISAATSEKPVVVWGEPNVINEGSISIKEIPTISKVYDKLSGNKFFPNETSERGLVKKLKFPIVGVSESGEEEFKTYGKFKKSEKYFNKFREKLVPATRFDIISFKKEPIHIQERINGLGFDVDLNRFKYLNETEDLLNNLGSNFDLDFYHISLIESSGKVYLENIGRSLKLSPSQALKLYETAYSDHYEVSLPGWFKKSAFDTHVKPYYQKRYYDSLLIKPKNSIDFKKYVDLA